MRIQIRRDTALNWYNADPVLYSGELGYETDTQKLKIGTGGNWNNTDYFVFEDTNLNNLKDVTITSAAGGDFLRYDGSASIWINDAVNLATDTIGNYVESLVAGTGIGIDNNSGEGSTPTVYVVENTYDIFGSAKNEANTASIATLAVALSAASAAYTDSYVDSTVYTEAALDLLTTDDIEEGGMSLYFTPQRAIDSASAAYDAIGAAFYEASLALDAALLYAENGASAAVSAANIYTQTAASAAVSAANIYSDGLTYSLDDLTTVTAPSPASGEFLKWDGTAWVNDTLTINDVTDVNISSATLDDVLVWDGSDWVNQNNIHLSSTTESTDSDSGALIVDGGTGIKKNLHVGGVGHFGGVPTVSLDNAIAYFLGDADAAVQIGLQNSSSASYASADYVATADDGNDTSKYLDLGINNSTYNDPDYSATGPNDAYLYVDGGHLVIGTATGDKEIKFNIGGTQSTDIMGTWSETALDIATNFSVSGSAQFGAINTGIAHVDGLTADELSVQSPSASVVSATIAGHAGQTANLTDWKNSAGTVLAHVDKDGNITAPTFVGTTIGNLSFYGINNTGSQINKGSTVYITGLDVPSGNPTIALADVADSAKMPCAGIAGANIADSATGEIIIIGQLHGIDTSSYSYGDVLYVDGLGSVTNVRPTNAAYPVQTIGNIERVATAINGGSIVVNSTGTSAITPNTIAIPGSVTASAGFYGSGANITSLNANNLSAGTVPSARLSLSASDIPTLTASKISDFETTAKGYTLDSFAAPTAAVSMNSQKITNMADPTSGSDAATKTYVDNLSSGLRIKQAVNYATAGVLPNSPTYTDGTADSSQGLGVGAKLESSTNARLSIDGTNIITGERVLIKDEANAVHNGIYYVTAQGSAGGGGSHWILTRADDSNNSPAGEVRKGDYVSVLAGPSNIGTSWTIGNDGTATTPLNGIKLGTDSINYIQFNGAASYVAGGGMTLSGTTFDVVSASSDRIVVNADSIDLATVTRTNSTNSASTTFIGDVTTDSYGRVTAVTKGEITDASTSTKGIASFDSGDFAVTSGAVTIKTAGVDNTQLANSSVTIGSTSVSLGGTASSLSGLSSVSATTFSGDLTGSVTGNASSVTNGVYTTDTGTVTNTMLAGSISDSKLSTISTTGKVSNSATTATAVNTASAIVARDASGNFTANIITAELSGNASTATSATSATNATNAAITDTTTTAGTYYPVFSSTSTGNSTLRTDSTGLTYNPSTNTLTATTFSGALSGNASTVTNGVYTTSSINALNDVDTATATPTSGQFLKWDGANWIPSSIPTINYLDDIGDVSASAPSSGQFLKWNGTAWVADSIPTINALDDIGNVTAPSPSDGQFLKYVSASSAWIPSSIPTINALDDIGDVSASAPSSGQFLKWNGTAWVADSVPTINTLDDVGDVTITSATIGQTVTWNGSAWVNSSVIRDNLVRFYMEVM